MELVYLCIGKGKGYIANDDRRMLPGFDVNAWFALYAPAGTPPEAIKTLVAAAEKALASNDLKQKLQQTSTQPGTIFGADLTAFEAKERERWHKLIQDKHIQSK